MPSFRKPTLAAAALAVLISSFAAAQQLRITAQQPTELADVIRSTSQFYPTIQAAQARIREKQADSLAATGAFDPRIDGNVSSRLGGFYDGSSGGAGLYKNLPFLGAEIFTEYAISDGSFPIYEDQLVTANTGEARVGLALSLIRDRDIDDQRFALLKAELETDIAGLSLQNERIAIFQQAYIAYARWLISARLFNAYNELLSVATVRGEALERQVSSGDVAEILLIENEQAILQRESLVVDANRQVELAAERLSLFLRSSEGLPTYPAYDDSLNIPVDAEEFLNLPVAQIVDLALTNRPDIAAAKILQEQLQLEIQLAENLAKPQLDLKFYSARDFGNALDNRLGTDHVVELSFSIPLETRTARGKRASANERLIGVGYDLRLLIDEAERDMRSSLVNLRATGELKDVALRELEVAQTLADAEARRFEAGTSDYFLLNVRERMLGEAQLRRWQAELNHQIALANYYGISMNLPIIDEVLAEPVEE
ncbi:MAG: multidrug transporter [Pseudohongiella sp.]|nr:MAG: multidrug transporter [Pseudohongiella sp.]